jgi:DNA processing protein
MIRTIDFHINELNFMKKYPEEIFYIGNLDLLKKKKISVVGSRSPNQYSRLLTHQLISRLSLANITIVSGGAIGIDTIAHSAAGFDNTIMVAGTGLDKRYPTINKKMITKIEREGLVLSQFKEGINSNKYNFPLRNELVVALGDILIVSYADLNSGTMRSIEYALKMDKKIYVLPHRIGESEGTNKLLKESKAKAIYDIDNFVKNFTDKNELVNPKNSIFEYYKTNPTFDEALKKYGNKIFEHELEGKIEVKNGKITPVLVCS